MRPLWVGVLALAATAHASASAVCARGTAAAPTTARLREAMAQGRFIAYTPTSLRIVNGKPTRAEPEAIRGDL